MPFVPTPDGVKVCLRYNNQGQLSCNIFHVKVEEEITATLLNGIGAFFANWWITNMKPLTANATSLQAVEVTDVSVEGGQGIEYTTGLPSVGTDGGANMPQNVTVTTKLTTGMTGRSQRGRSYFVGLPQSFVAAGGFLSNAGQAAIDAAFEALITGLATNSWPLAIASLVHNGVPRVTGQLTEVIAASVNLALDSQRRRLPERGA